jgi:DNA processing protein
MLYVRGDASLLSLTDTVAVVGTRDPTDYGVKTAHRIADSLARSGYVIVSGLARGIDTAAHTAALEADGRTIAVLGTPLNEIYPAENKGLAKRIADQSGLLVSEIPLGKSSSKLAFVRRDRIQSGLSLAVFAIQTDLNGGTMHTVTYAEKQGRLIFCPTPTSEDVSAKQNAGIMHLIRSGRAHQFDDPSRGVLRLLKRQKKVLLQNRPSTKRVQGNRQSDLAQQKLVRWT